MVVRPWLVCAVVGLAVTSGAAHAQYKWQDAQGRVGYSDMPPAGNVKILRAPNESVDRRGSARAEVSTSGPQLPFELAQIAQRSPVVLYTTTDCAPCELGRQHLARRGVPFTERIVSSAQDLVAFQKLGFAANDGLPAITAGTQKRTGYHAAQWDELFTSAGYPRESRLPSGWPAPKAEALAVQSQQAPDLAAATVPDLGATRASVLERQRNFPSIAPQQADIRF